MKSERSNPLLKLLLGWALCLIATGHATLETLSVEEGARHVQLTRQKLLSGIPQETAGKRDLHHSL